MSGRRVTVAIVVGFAFAIAGDLLTVIDVSEVAELWGLVIAAVGTLLAAGVGVWDNARTSEWVSRGTQPARVSGAPLRDTAPATPPGSSALASGV